MTETLPMRVKIKKLVPEAVIPQYAKPGDFGMDLVATSINVTDDYIEYGTGLSVEIPYGFVGLIFPRSSNSKKDLLLCNSVGCVDSGYRGELMLRFKSTPTGEYDTDGFEIFKTYHEGDRVGQLAILPYPQVQFVESEELSETERGAGGFGHTGS